MAVRAPKAAIYVRVSTDSESQRDSPLHQVETCREYASTLGLETSGDLVYNDAGLSGTELEHRTEVKRLLHDARHGLFEVVLFTAISRFSRDLSDAFSMKKKLESVYGIRLISIEEGYDTSVDGRNNDMVFTVHAMLAAHKAKEMSVAIRRGRRQAAKRGRHTGNHSPYGYQKTKDKRLQPDPQTAPIVVQVFEWANAGYSTRQIAQELNQRQVPTASQLQGKGLTRWQSSTIHAILHNEVYVGRIVANRWTKQRDIEQSRQYDRQVRKLSLRSDAEWVIVDSAHPPLVSRDLFNSVQALLQRTGQANSRHPTLVNLMAGLAVCGECGSNMVLTGSQRRSQTGEVRKYRYLVCSRAKRFGQSACTNRVSVPYLLLTQNVLRALSEMWNAELLHSAGICAQDPAEKIHLGLSFEELEKYRRDLSMIEERLKKNKQRQRNNLQAYQEGLFTQDVIAEEQTTLLKEAHFLEEERKRLKRQLSADDVTKRPESMRDCWNGESDSSLTWQRMVLTTLVEQIVILSTGHIRVYLTFKYP